MSKHAIVLLLSILPRLGHAQYFAAGPCVGIAATQVDGDTYGGYHKAGPIAGLWVEYRNESAWSTMAKFRYIQKGCFAKGEMQGSTQYKLRLNYIELPLLAIYKLKPRLNLCMGLSGGYLASRREYNIGGEIPHEHAVKLRHYEIAAMGGASFCFTERIRAEAIFSYSVTRLVSTPLPAIHWRSFGPFNNVVELSLLYEL